MSTSGYPVANTIGDIGRGFQQQMQQFQNERLMASYLAVGQCASAIERTLDYLRQRRAFGKPLVEHQWIQFHMAELSAEVDMLRHYNYAAAEAMSRRRGRDAKIATIAKLKAGRLLPQGRRHVPAVPRRHRLHGRDVDDPLFP